jgi:peptide deformylase
VYPNIKVDSLYGEPVLGPEGCLSVPDMMGKVLRYPDIIVSYTDIGTMQTVRDTVSGFTAVIFQHETDHLDGILYTDKAEEVIPL